MKAKLLVVDDDLGLCELLSDTLGNGTRSVRFSTDPLLALELLQQEDFDVLVTDIQMKGMTGIELCRRAADLRPELLTIVITAFGSLESAVQAIRAGAYDFITKPFDTEAVAIAVDRAVQHRRLRQEVRRLKQAVQDLQQFEDLIGASPAMKRVYDMITRIAPLESTVLVTGETGTGKELVARAIHRRSRRASGPFVAMSCAAVPEQLLESELFGHARGAFTDAKGARAGLFAQARAGTIFLDEIGDMPLGLQSKLLRALQEHAIRPVGADQEIPMDVRVVAATHRDLDALVEEGTFREDLYYRINVIHIELPPLRARGADVLLLAQLFLERFAVRSSKEVVSLSGPAAEKLMAYSWPGNVRELQNCLERAVALAEHESLGVQDLPSRIQNYRSSHVVVASSDPSELVPLDEVEKRYILRVLEAVGGNKLLASRVLGLDRKTLYRKLERYSSSSSSNNG